MALMLKTPLTWLVPHLPLCGWKLSMNAWLMKGYADTVPMSLDESAKLDGVFRRFWPCSSTCSLWCCASSLGLMNLSGTISLVSCFVRRIALPCCRWSQTFVNNAKNMKIAYFSAGAILIALQSVFSSSSYKELCFQDLQVVATRG